MRIAADSHYALKSAWTPRVEELLTAYHWPGNVRELSNVLERVVSYLERDTIYPCDLPFYLSRVTDDPSAAQGASLKELMARTQVDAIRFALKTARGNKARAAKMLGIHRTLLYKKMQKYSIEAE